ncbi:unnamed protein product [Ectocarpus sp. CCAP 1310/34]|nr:unnamed protein product [Ectocarpus sp. CCAP 1310/34]
MATRLACSAASRARSSALRAGIRLNAPRCRADPSRGIAAALISSSSCSRTSTTPTAASGHTNTAPTSTAAAAAAAAAPAAGTQGGNVGTAGTTSSAAADAKAGSAAEPFSNTGSDPSSTNTGGADSSSSGGSGGGGGGGSRGPLTWGAVGLLGIVASLAVGYYRMKWEEKQNRTASEVTSTGKPALGGPFTLVDMHGKPVTEKDYHGSFVLLYFGFCHCPDICPSELVKVGAIATKLEDKLGAGVVKPVFVSVDPDRDSLAQLKHYAQDFHHSIEYLTGTKDQVAKAAKAYRVYFSKTEEHEEGEDYLLDHSIVIYLLAPNGDFLDFFTQRTTIADCVDRTVKNVKDFKA